MKSALTIIIVLVVGFLLGSYLNKNNINPLTKGALTRVSTHSMEDSMDSMTHDLMGKVGGTFDKAFLTGMITHHQGAIAMAELAKISSSRPEIQQMAKDIIATQSKEIDQMRAWKKAWFPEE